MSEFIEEKLELGYDYGKVDEMRFKTTIINKEDKQKQRFKQHYLLTQLFELFI